MNHDRLTNLDVLRGLAALSVCFFHFERDNFIGIEAVSSVFLFGYLGVHVFFVLSGFVIPLALSRKRFRVSQSGSFFISRFFRLYPAYMTAAAAAIGLELVASHFSSISAEHPPFTLWELFANAAFLCDFTGDRWIIPVFWTLSIEAQYYFVIALTFPLLAYRSLIARHSMLLLWIFAPLVAGEGPSVFTWTSLFSIGILCFLKNTNRISNLLFWAYFAANALSLNLTKNLLTAVVGSAVGLAILYLPELKSRSLIWMGAISYSLYLVHTITGARVITLGGGLPAVPAVRLAALLAAFAVAIAAATVFYFLVEKPSHSLSRRVKAKPKQEQAHVLEPRAGGELV